EARAPRGGAHAGADDPSGDVAEAREDEQRAGRDRGLGGGSLRQRGEGRGDHGADDQAGDQASVGEELQDRAAPEAGERREGDQRDQDEVEEVHGVRVSSHTASPGSEGTRMRLEGRRTLVTGGTTGLGYAIAERFLAEGARVVFTGRNEKLGREAEERLGAERARFLRA